MAHHQLLFNLLSYRSFHTGLSRYAERLLAAWSYSPPPHQLRLTSSGNIELCQTSRLAAGQHRNRSVLAHCRALMQRGLSLRSLLQDHWPDRIYSPYTDWLWALSDIPQVITCHDLIPLHYPNSRRAYLSSRFWTPKLLHRANLVVAISRAVADQLITAGVPASKITVITNGIETSPNPIQAPSSRDLLLLARHAPHKNIALALSAYSKLLRRDPTWPGRLVVVGGPGRCTSALQRQQVDLGIAHRLSWYTDLSSQSLDALMRASFCLLSPSLMEGFDYPLMEAQSLGLPTLASRIPVHVELHQGVSLFFETDDQGDTMASLIQQLDREPALWHQLSRAGLHNAAVHSIPTQVNHLWNVLQSPLPPRNHSRLFA